MSLSKNVTSEEESTGSLKKEGDKTPNIQRIFDLIRRYFTVASFVGQQVVFGNVLVPAVFLFFVVVVRRFLSLYTILRSSWLQS